MTAQEKNNRFYKFAYNFLLENTPSEITEEIIKPYLIVPEPERNCKNLNDIYCRMLFSAQNKQMSRNVIGGKIRGVENLGKVLNDFDPKFVIERYLNKEDILLKDIMKKFNL